MKIVTYICGLIAVGLLSAVIWEAWVLEDPPGWSHLLRPLVVRTYAAIGASCIWLYSRKRWRGETENGWVCVCRYITAGIGASGIIWISWVVFVVAWIAVKGGFNSN